jgi:hypothetical protein
MMSAEKEARWRSILRWMKQNHLDHSSDHSVDNFLNSLPAIKGNTVFEAMQCLLRQELQIEIEAAQATSLLTFEIGGRESYLIQRPEQPTLILTKSLAVHTFSYSPFLQLLSGATFLSETSFRYSQKTRPLALGKFHEKGETYGLYVEEIAASRPLDELVKQIAKWAPPSLERDQAALPLYYAIRHAGMALGEWQTLVPFYKAKDLSHYGLLLQREAMQYLQTKASQVGALYLKPIDLKKYIEDLLTLCQKVEHYYVYAYGNADLHHLLYREQSPNISVISSERIDRSIGEDGRPKGDMGYDYVRFLEWMEMQACEVLVPAELNKAKKAFEIGYEMVAGILPSLEQQRIYQGYIRLKLLRQCASQLDDSSTPEKRQESVERFNHILKLFVHLLKG